MLSLPAKLFQKRKRLFLHHLRDKPKSSICGMTLRLGLVFFNLCRVTPFLRYLAPVRKVNWVVYAKAPLGGAEQVLQYVGRYTHRVAISNHRLLDIEAGKVCFRWKDYRDQHQQKTMTLRAEEFIRRFLLQILPARFQRIRCYGLMGNRYREQKLARCRQLLGMSPPQVAASESSPDYRDHYEQLTGRSLRACAVCHQGRMVVIEVVEGVYQAPAVTDTS